MTFPPGHWYPKVKFTGEYYYLYIYESSKLNIHTEKFRIRFNFSMKTIFKVKQNLSIVLNW